MIYHVRARFKAETARDFHAKLSDGSIANQRPDGPELIASMDRAVVNAEGQVEWSETCYCTPPLAHERATVLDMHFEDIVTEPVEAHTRFDGQPFVASVRKLAG